MPEYYPRSRSRYIAFWRLMQLLPPPLLFRGGRLVVLPRLVRRLAAEALEVLQPVGVQPAAIDRRSNRAARFPTVRAVGEAARRRQRR